jgi:hypothetical protein
MSTKATYSVGGLEDDPATELRHRNGYLRATRLGSGGMAVADEFRVQFFDAAGKRASVAGREGSGPEEFRGIISICATRGDTIVANDGRNSRATIVAPNGRIVRTAPEGLLGSPGFDGCLNDGTFIRVYYLPAERGADRTVRVTRVRLDGSVANVVGEFSIGPFDAFLDRDPTIAASGQSVYVADGMNHEVRVYRAGGGLERIDSSPPCAGSQSRRRGLHTAASPLIAQAGSGFRTTRGSSPSPTDGRPSTRAVDSSVAC